MAFGFSSLSNLLKKDALPVQSNTVIGVDVGSSSIKIVQLQNKKGVATLDTYGELQLGPYGAVDIGRTTRLRIDKLIEAFVDILREAQAGSEEVVTAISYSSSFITLVSVPEKDPDKIAAMIPIEARKYVPVPLTEVVLDWYPVSIQVEGKGTRILLSAVHKEARERLHGMIEGAELREIGEEIELFSVIRSAVKQSDTTVAVIDCGASSSKLYIVHNGVISRTHSIALSGVGLTEDIARVHGISFREAEERKRNEGMGVIVGSLELEKAFSHSIERGFREIQTVIALSERESGESVEKIILVGSGSLLVGLPKYIAEMTGKTVVYGNPFEKVSYPAFLEDTLREAGPTFGVALGAALNGLSQQQ